MIFWFHCHKLRYAFTFTPSTAKDRLRHQLAAPGLLRRFVYNNLKLSSDLGATELKPDLMSRDALKQSMELNCRSGRAFHCLIVRGKKLFLWISVRHCGWMNLVSSRVEPLTYIGSCRPELPLTAL